jgi:hypothetical protein
VSIIRWISSNDPDLEVRKYFQGFIYRFSVETTDSFLDGEMKNFNSPLGRLFFQLLKQNLRGGQNLSKLFSRFSKIAEGIDQLQRRERGMLFVPKFQTWVAAAMSLFFVMGLPLISHEYFPTFISLHRGDLLFVGLAILALGFYLLHWMCRRPQKQLKPHLELVFFLQFLSLFIESGLDLISAWYKAIDVSNMDSRLRSQLRRKDLSVETMDDFLNSLSKSLKAPWPELLMGVLWAKMSGIGLSQYLQSASDRQSEILLSLWDEEIRKLTITTIIPLGLLIFPAALFILIGPQFLALVNL